MECASRIPDWKKVPQMELAKLYEEDFENRDCYLSALVVRYWNILSKACYQNKGIFPEEEAYDWYIDSVLKVLEEKPWLNEDSTLYQDDKAFEKAVNVRFFCTKVNWFQASNRLKRKLNHGIVSLEQLKEDYNDSTDVPYLVEEPQNTDYKEFVINAFYEKRYLLALIFDLIFHNIDVNEIDNYNQLFSAIKKEIHTLNLNSKIFADEYELPKDEVDKAFNSILNMSEEKLKSSVEGYIYKIRSNLILELFNDS